MSENDGNRQIERVVLRLRQFILEGRFAPGEHLAEIALADMLALSRTPVRAALALLEREGLVVSAPRRGYSVREFTVEQIVEAIDVRGALEALACRMALERGMRQEALEVLHDCMQQGEALLAQGYFNAPGAQAWSAMNARFHAQIVAAAHSQPLSDAIAHNARLPMVAAGAIAFHAGNLDAAFGMMKIAFAEHADIVSALSRGQMSRAEALVREHAFKSRENLRIALEKMRDLRGTDEVHIPGLKLVVG
jgi:GntR family transcriptional regulator of vanillate catabolism